MDMAAPFVVKSLIQSLIRNPCPLNYVDNIDRSSSDTVLRPNTAMQSRCHLHHAAGKFSVFRFNTWCSVRGWRRWISERLCRQWLPFLHSLLSTKQCLPEYFESYTNGVSHVFGARISGFLAGSTTAHIALLRLS